MSYRRPQFWAGEAIQKQEPFITNCWACFLAQMLRAFLMFLITSESIRPVRK